MKAIFQPQNWFYFTLENSIVVNSPFVFYFISFFKQSNLLESESFCHYFFFFYLPPIILIKSHSFLWYLQIFFENSGSHPAFNPSRAPPLFISGRPAPFLALIGQRGKKPLSDWRKGPSVLFRWRGNPELTDGRSGVLAFRTPLEQSTIKTVNSVAVVVADGSQTLRIDTRAAGKTLFRRRFVDANSQGEYLQECAE